LPGKHTRPQVPQFWELVLVLISQPLAKEPSQSAKPELHDVTTHIPLEQPTVLALATIPQTRPQPPQLLGSALMFVSQPLAAIELQCL
jgi:hypothetical protein